MTDHRAITAFVRVPTGGPGAAFGPPGPTGPPGPAAPADEVVTVLGGITTLAQKTYSARLPIDKDSTLVSVAVACEAGNANVGLQTIRNGVALGSVMTLLAGNAYQAFPVSYPCSAGDVIQFACVTPVGSVPPKSVTIQYRWVVA